MALNGIPINANECIGDSLQTINNAFQTLDTRLSQVSSTTVTSSLTTTVITAPSNGLTVTGGPLVPTSGLSASNLLTLSAQGLSLFGSRILMGPDAFGNAWIGGRGTITEYDRSAVGFHMGADGGVDTTFITAGSGYNRVQIGVSSEANRAYVSFGASGGEWEDIQTRSNYTYYVDPVIGNDSYNGLAETVTPLGFGTSNEISGPFKTLERAINSSKNKLGVTIQLSKGTHVSQTSGSLVFADDQTDIIINGQPMLSAEATAISTSWLNITTNGPTQLTAANLEITIDGWKPGQLAAIQNSGAEYLHIYYTKGLDAHPAAVAASTRVGSTRLSASSELYSRNFDNLPTVGPNQHGSFQDFGIGLSATNDQHNWLLVGNQHLSAISPGPYGVSVNLAGAPAPQITKNSDGDLVFVGNTLNRVLQPSLYAGCFNDDINLVASNRIKVTNSTHITRGDLIYINNTCASVIEINPGGIPNTLMLDTSGCLLSGGITPFAQPIVGNTTTNPQLPFFVKSHHEQLLGSWRIVNINVGSNTITLKSDHLPWNSFWSRQIRARNLWSGIHGSIYTAGLYDVPKRVNQIAAYVTPTKINTAFSTVLFRGCRAVIRDCHIDGFRNDNHDNPNATIYQAVRLIDSAYVNMARCPITNCWDGVEVRNGSTLTVGNTTYDWGSTDWNNFNSVPQLVTGAIATGIYAYVNASVNRIPLIFNGVGNDATVADTGATIRVPMLYGINVGTLFYCARQGTYQVSGPVFTIAARIGGVTEQGVVSMSYWHGYNNTRISPYTTGFFKGGYNSFGDGFTDGGSTVLADSYYSSRQSGTYFGSMYHWRTGATNCEAVSNEGGNLLIHRTTMFGSPIRTVDGFFPVLYNVPLYHTNMGMYIRNANASFFNFVAAGFANRPALAPHLGSQCEFIYTHFINNCVDIGCEYESQVHGTVGMSIHNPYTLVNPLYRGSLNPTIASTYKTAGIRLGGPSNVASYPFGLHFVLQPVYENPNIYLSTSIVDPNNIRDCDNTIMINRTNTVWTSADYGATTNIQGVFVDGQTLTGWTNAQNNKLIIQRY